jgi:hypothetical protein
VGKRDESRPDDGDVAVAVGKDEHGIHILRRRGEGATVEAGVVQPLAEGRPIRGEVISMRQRPDLPFVFDVKTEMADPNADGPRDEGRATSAGPSQVANDSYRKGWDAIWGRKRIADGPVN